MSRFLLSILFSIWIFSCLAQAEAIATVVAFAGNSTINGRAVTTNAAVAEHDKISVSLGNVQLIFRDGTKLVVGENSSLVVETYLMGGGNTASSFAIDALRGTFRFITGHSAKAAYNIQTANSTIGIRGTGFDFWVNNDTGVVVMEGKVRLCRKGTKSCVDIDANCHAGVARVGGTQALQWFVQSQSIRNHLPFILDQSRLRQPFHLAIEQCDKVLGLTDQGSGSPNPPSSCPRGRKC